MWMWMWKTKCYQQVEQTTDNQLLSHTDSSSRKLSTDGGGGDLERHRREETIRRGDAEICFKRACKGFSSSFACSSVQSNTVFVFIFKLVSQQQQRLFCKQTVKRSSKVAAARELRGTECGNIAGKEEEQNK